MRIYFILTFLILSFATIAGETDSIFIDSTYRLTDINNSKKMVDTNVRLIMKYPDPPTRIRRGPSGGNHPIGSNYGSTQNVDPKIATIISVIFLIFILYLIYRVRKSLKNDKIKPDE